MFSWVCGRCRHIYICVVCEDGGRGWCWASSSVTLYTETGPLSWTQSTLIRLAKLACLPWEPRLYFPGAGAQTDNYMAAQDPNSGLCSVACVFPVSHLYTPWRFAFSCLTFGLALAEVMFDHFPFVFCVATFIRGFTLSQALVLGVIFFSLHFCE